MRRLLIGPDGRVENVIKVGPDYRPPDGHQLLEPQPDAQIGDLWDEATGTFQPDPERVAREQEEAGREAEREAAEKAQRDAVRNARSVAELRDAIVAYLGIGEAEGDREGGA